MRYAVIGAGAMGYRYGLHLIEQAGCQVDFIDTWEPNVETVRKQGGVWVQRDHKGRHLVPVNIYYPEDYAGDPDVWIVFMKQMQLENMLERCADAGLFKDHQTVFTAMNGLGHRRYRDRAQRSRRCGLHGRPGNRVHAPVRLRQRVP